MPNLSYPLFNAALIDPRTGYISRPWQQWLTALWVRVGEANAPTLGDINEAIQAEYLVASANVHLTAERLVTNTPTITWDFTAAGQAKANLEPEGVQDAVGTILQGTSTVLLAYDDGTPKITADVIDGSITYTKLQSVSAASRLLGRGSAAGAGVAQEITLGTGIAMTGTTLSSTGAPGGSDTQVQYNAAGVFAGITGAVSNGTTLTVRAPNFEVTDNADTTKIGKFAVNITTGTTRTYTMPDKNGTLLLNTDNIGQLASSTSSQLRGILSDETGTGVAVFNTSPTILTPVLTVADSEFTLQDDSDTTKTLRFQLSGITTGTLRTLTVPNVSGTLLVSGSVIDQENAFVEAPTNKTYALVPSSRFSCTINSVRNLKTVSGTLTLAIQINGTNVTGLNSLAVTSTPQDPTASGANAVSIGDRITFVVTSASSPVDLEFTLEYTR